MTYPEYQAALKHALITYRGLPKTPDSAEAYQTQTQAIHQQYRIAKAVAAVAEQSADTQKKAESRAAVARERAELKETRAMNTQRVLDERVEDAEIKLQKLQDDEKEYVGALSRARQSHLSAEENGGFSCEGGEQRRQQSEACIQRYEEHILRASAMVVIGAERLRRRVAAADRARGCPREYESSFGGAL